MTRLATPSTSTMATSVSSADDDGVSELVCLLFLFFLGSSSSVEEDGRGRGGRLGFLFFLGKRLVMFSD